MADQPDALSRIAPEVRTLARPTSGPLLAARGVIQRTPQVQALFLQAKEENWGASRLAEAITPHLQETLEASEEEVRHTAQYLAAEYEQLGNTMLLIDRRTGRALAQITEDDIWEGPMAPRESGGMATPLPRLNPNLEAFLYQHVHEQEREANLSSTLAARNNQTAFLEEEGDRRLLIVTRQGRRQIEAEIQRHEQIFSSSTGLVAKFFQYFDQVPKEGMALAFTALAMARTRTNISDPIAMSFRYDHAAMQHRSLVNEWAREIARSLSVEAHTHTPPESVSWEHCTHESLKGAKFWIVDPDDGHPFVRLAGISVFYVPGTKPTGFTDLSVGALLTESSSVKVTGRDLFDRWDVVGQFNYTVYLDWSKVVTIELSGKPISEPETEVVR